MAGRESRSFVRIDLSEARKRAILSSFVGFYADVLDEELSTYQAERVLEFFIKELGPPVYNQAIQDARRFMLEKLEDLDAEFYEPPEPGSHAR